METVIEIGDDNQRSQIEKELHMFEKVFVSIPIFQEMTIASIFIPLDFEAKVNSLENITTYQAHRNIVVAMARIVVNNGKSSIILSPSLFNQEYDVRARFFILFHELTHIWNKNHLSKTENAEGSTRDFYLYWLNALFDEYAADRVSYSIVEDVFDVTEKWASFIRQVVLGFLNEVLPPERCDYIKAEIASFRVRNDVNLFLTQTQETAESIMLLSVHAFSLFHHYPQVKDEIQFEELHFVNGNTFAFMNYLKEKYETESCNLEDGVDFIRNYIKNFGVLFEDRPLGRYCHVVDL